MVQIQHVVGDGLVEGRRKRTPLTLGSTIESSVVVGHQIWLLALCEKSQSCVWFGANSKTRALANPWDQALSVGLTSSMSPSPFLGLFQQLVNQLQVYHTTKAPVPKVSHFIFSNNVITDLFCHHTGFFYDTMKGTTLNLAFALCKSKLVKQLVQNEKTGQCFNHFEARGRWWQIVQKPQLETHMHISFIVIIVIIFYLLNSYTWHRARMRRKGDGQCGNESDTGDRERRWAKQRITMASLQQSNRIANAKLPHAGETHEHTRTYTQTVLIVAMSHT